MIVGEAPSVVSPARAVTAAASPPLVHGVGVTTAPPVLLTPVQRTRATRTGMAPLPDAVESKLMSQPRSVAVTVAPEAKPTTTLVVLAAKDTNPDVAVYNLGISAFLATS